MSIILTDKMVARLADVLRGHREANDLARVEAFVWQDEDGTVYAGPKTRVRLGNAAEERAWLRKQVEGGEMTANNMRRACGHGDI